MSLQYSEPAFPTLLQEFDAFVSKITHTSAPPSPNPNSLSTRLETEPLTPFEARLTLGRLLSKGRTGARKNWKVEETNYLLFLV